MTDRDFMDLAIELPTYQRNDLVVYNKTKYRLTHLLEKSHRVANKYGSYGKSTPQPHIEPAQKNAEEKFEKVFTDGLARIRI